MPPGIGEMVESSIDDVLDAVYAQVDLLCKLGEFNTLDKILDLVDVTELTPYVALAYLSSTSAAKEHLPARARLYQRAREHVLRTQPLRYGALLNGLE